MQITRDVYIKELDGYIGRIFLLPEVSCVKIRDVVVHKNENRVDKLQEITNRSYHDCYSDVDLSIVVNISTGDVVTPKAYMKRIDRFGINHDECLGYFQAEESKVYRVVFKSGMRYDITFEFVYDDNADGILLQSVGENQSNPNWPIENVDRFWFVQIQALGKLYRKDFLISDHLANMNLNETLVQQMVLRDLSYGTNHHRYGYEEAIAYLSNIRKCPIISGNEHFDTIADKIYCAALTYDELTLSYYPEYKERCSDFMEIWNSYEQNRIASN